jgi:hypothetical protein
MAVGMGAALLPRALRTNIRGAIEDCRPAWSQFVSDNLEDRGSPAGPSLAVKYVPSRFAATYRSPNPGLFIGSSNFTWGRGVYVTGVQEPLSTAIYGRIGIVARINDPANWTCFDARDPANEALYLQWLNAQVDYPEAVLTVHSDHWLHQLRNLFREQFQIDVVLFHPDEADLPGWYTRPIDTWLAVSDWTSTGLLSSGYSGRFSDARLTILIEDEFVADKPALTRSPQLAVSGKAPASATLPADARTAYARGDICRVES